MSYLAFLFIHLNPETLPVAAFPRRVSTPYLTPSAGEGAGPDFVNMAVELRTYLLRTSGLLTAALRRIEAQLGRTRDPTNKNAPRTIDLDAAVVMGGDVRHIFVDEDVLRHAHVAVPVAELIPDFLFPVGMTPGTGAGQVTLLELSRRLTQCTEPFKYFPVAPIDLTGLCPSPPAEAPKGAWHRLRQILMQHDPSGRAQEAITATPEPATTAKSKSGAAAPDPGFFHRDGLLSALV